MRLAASISLDLIPGVSNTKSIVEALLGMDIITFEALTPAEQAMSVAGIVAGPALKGVAASAQLSMVVRKIAGAAGKFDVPTGKLGEYMGKLREMGRTKGNFGIGTGIKNEAGFLGESWVGPNAIRKDYPGKPGKSIYVSLDGLKQYREPVSKPNLGRSQANFEWRTEPIGPWIGNAHLDVIE